MQLTAAQLHTDKRWLDLVHHKDLTLLLDMDGTLIPFAPTAEQAVLDDYAAETLARLRRAQINVVIVSGRPRDLLSPFRSRCKDIWWAAEHGSWRCDDSGEWCGPSAVAEIDELETLLSPFVVLHGARLERKSLSMCLHWRQCPDMLKGRLIAAAELACDEWLEMHPDFERIAGVEMLEVRRRASNKGTAVTWVRERNPGAKIIAIGDDVTDEDMFAALRDDEIAIGVGARHSARCALSVAGPAAVHELLRWVAELRTTESSRPFVGIAAKVPKPHPKSDLVVVSNRVPPTETGRTRQVGGLVSALEPALEAHGGTWLGWSGREAEGDRSLVIDPDDPSRAAFDFPAGWREHFYGGFCNRALWPLFHGFPGRVRYTDRDWETYETANAEFARHAHSLVTSSGTVWVHDYHLLLVARALRQRGFAGRIGLFLHIPFPSPDMFETIPWGETLVEAMLDFDLVGVHTQRWAQNFRAVAEPFATQRPLPEIAVLPIGVDPAHFSAGTASKEVANLQAALGHRRLILGVDRLDYSKGIPERLLAFERLLELHREWRGRVSLVQISVPSREEVPEYAQLRQEVEALVGRINGSFGEADWVPVRYLYRSYDRDVLPQIYRAADVALVTPLRDGLNLVAKEFVAAQDPAQPGVLVVSKFAGAADELTDAILTNPFHPDGLARDLHRALSMEPEERRSRHRRLFNTVSENTPQRWAAAFLDRLHRRERSVA
ncbi:MAG: trehalose-phosphatase [Kofleriaceae bacterium]